VGKEGGGGGKFLKKGREKLISASTHLPMSQGKDLSHNPPLLGKKKKKEEEGETSLKGGGKKEGGILFRLPFREDKQVIP